ncbi:MAG: YozE family protein [Ardenticatenaceae bacterium]
MRFNEWLTQQTQRDDAIGRLTRQLIHDSTSPLWSNKAAIYHQYFNKRGANAATVAAFECAWSEWRNRTCKAEHLEKVLA